MSALPDITQKVGPLPLGVWVLGGIGGIVLYEYKKRTSAAASTTSTTTVVPSVDTAGSGNGNPYTTAGNIGDTSSTGTTGTTTTGTTTLADNNAWYQKVFQDLVGRGYQPALVDGALQRYLAGQQLSTSDWAIVNAALADAPIPQPVGATTQPPPTVTIPGTPTTTTGLLPPTQASPPAKQATQAQVNAYLAQLAQLAKTRPASYTVAQGDTLATIAAKYYGNSALWANLYNANRNVITNPSVLTVGQTITLPSSPYA